MRECAKCRKQNDERSGVCAKCGEPLAPPPRRPAVTSFLQASPEVPPARRPLGLLSDGTNLSRGYVVRETLQPHETQRPGIYRCDSASGDLVVVKVAASEVSTDPDVWGQLTTLKHDALVPILETYEEGGFFWEVQPWMPGGTLSKRQFDNARPWLEKILVPQMRSALEYLHRKNIVHRDVKPGNIFVDGNDRPLLGDLDISRSLGGLDERLSYRAVAGTAEFMAPESFPISNEKRVIATRITASSDYYSLGLTLLKLLGVETPLSHMAEVDVAGFYMRGQLVEVPPTLDDRWRTLVRGLLLKDPLYRWGAEEVSRWEREASTEHDRQRIEEGERQASASPARWSYKLGEQTAFDLRDLARLFLENETEGLKRTTRVNREFTLNRINELDTDAAIAAREDLEAFGDTDTRLALWCVVLRCDPTRPFPFSPSIEARSPAEWLDAAARAGPEADFDAFVSAPALLRRLAVWVERRSPPDRALGQAVWRLIQSPDAERGPEVDYLLRQDAGLVLLNGVAPKKPREIPMAVRDASIEGSRFTADPFDRFLETIRSGRLFAFLRQRGAAELEAPCRERWKALESRPYVAAEAILRVLDPEPQKLAIQFGAFELRDEGRAEEGVGYLGLSRSRSRAPASLPSDRTGRPTRRLRRLEWGQPASILVPWRTDSAGFAFASLELTGPTGFSLEESQLEGRQGVVVIRIPVRSGAVAARENLVRIALGEGNATGKDVSIPLYVHFPIWKTVWRAVLGAAYAGTILGAVRYLLAKSGFRGADSVATIADKWKHLTSGRFLNSFDAWVATFESIDLAMVLGAAFLILATWKALIWAWRTSESIGRTWEA